MKEEREFYFLDECPFVGRRHSGDPHKTALILGDRLGFKCFSDKCDGKSIGGLLRHFGNELEFKPYPYRLFTEREGIEVGGDGEDAEWPAVKLKQVAATPTQPEPLVQEIAFAPAADEFDGMEEPMHAPLVQTLFPLQPDQSAIPITDEALYGWLGDKARTLQAPLGWAYPAMLTVFAAQ